jgi:hypothetical protein
VLIDGAAPANPKPEQTRDARRAHWSSAPGGYGAPAERDAELLALDRLDGYVLGA